MFTKFHIGMWAAQDFVKCLWKSPFKRFAFVFTFALGALFDLKIVKLVLHILENHTIISLPYGIDERVRKNENT
jgi:hypothetical protein